jgi:hypothetical protein
VTVVGILWVTLTPYCTGLVVASSRRANHLVTRHLRVSIGLGWMAIAVLLAGVFAVGGRLGVTMALASAPLIGLAFWKTGPGRDDGDDPPPEPDDTPPRPTGVRLPSPPRSRPAGHRHERRPTRQRV